MPYLYEVHGRKCIWRTYLCFTHSPVNERQEVGELLRYFVDHDGSGNYPTNGRAASQECRPNRDPVGEIVYEIADDDVPASRMPVLHVCEGFILPRFHHVLESRHIIVAAVCRRLGRSSVDVPAGLLGCFEDDVQENSE